MLARWALLVGGGAALHRRRAEVPLACTALAGHACRGPRGGHASPNCRRFVGLSDGDCPVVCSLVRLSEMGIKPAWGPLSPADLPALAFPPGAGLLTWLLSIVSWLGVPIMLFTVGAVYLAILLVIGVGFPWQRKRAPRGAEVEPEGQPSKRQLSGRAAVWSAPAILFSTSAILAVGRSYPASDDITIWTVKGYGIAREGTIFAGTRWGAHRLSYPLNLPLLIPVFRLVDGDVLPGSELIFPMTHLSLALGCYGFWRNHHVRPWVAGQGCC